MIEDPDTLIDDASRSIDDEPTALGISIPAGLDLDGPTVAGGPDLAAPDLAAPDLAASALAAPDEAAVASLVEEGRAIVDTVARVVSREVGYREIAELCSVGRAALVEAARGYDRARARFSGFVAQRLRWAMIDHVRREGRMHGVRRRAAALAAAELVAEARAEIPGDTALPTEETARAALAASLADHAAALAVGLVATRPRAGEHVDPSPDPEVAFDVRRTAEELHAAVAQLPDRQRVIVERHYFHDERFDHIAESMGVSKSWACRLHAQALADLGRVLRRR